MIEPSHLPASSRLKRARGFQVVAHNKKSVIARARLAAGLLCFGAAAVTLSDDLTRRLTDDLRQPALAAMAAALRCLRVSGNQRVTVPAGSVPSSFLVKGKYVEFTVDAATFTAYTTGRLPACRIRSISPGASAQLCSRAKCRTIAGRC